MEYNKKEIAQKIEDGSYFEDALQWYNTKFIMPVYTRSMMVLVAAFGAFAFIIVASNINSILTKNEEIPFIITSENTTDYYSVIKDLSSGGRSVQRDVARYLISKYIEERENYSYADFQGDNLKNILKRIKSSSLKKVLDEYKNYINKANPYSPVVRYGNRISRTVAVKDFKFIESDKTSGKAVVQFEAVEVDTAANIKKDLWEATINYKLPDIQTIAQTGAPLRFLVTYYRIKPILNAEKKNE